jgi:hypothetical protein
MNKSLVTARLPMFIAARLENTDTHVQMWLPLPANTETFADALRRIGAERGSFAVVGYSCRVPGICLDDLMRTPLANINHLASRLNGLTRDEIMLFGALRSTDYFPYNVAKCIEFTYHTDQYTLLWGITDEQALGEYYIGKPFQYAGNVVIKRLIDRRDIGRKIAESENGVFTPFGYITAKNGWHHAYTAPQSVPESLNLKGYIGEDIYGNWEEGDADYGI